MVQLSLQLAQDDAALWLEHLIAIADLITSFVLEKNNDFVLKSCGSQRLYQHSWKTASSTEAKAPHFKISKGMPSAAET